jgi:hypothetical protein
MPPIWPWTEEDRQNLRALYPEAPKKHILAKIRHHSWHAIQKEASRLKIKRVVRDEMEY